MAKSRRPGPAQTTGQQALPLAVAPPSQGASGGAPPTLDSGGALDWLDPAIVAPDRLLAPLPGMPERLAARLSRPDHRPLPFLLRLGPGPMPARRRRVARALLDLLGERGHPLVLATSLTLEAADIDRLGRLGRAGLVQAVVALPSLDARLAGLLEPGAAAPTRRVALVRALADQGVAVEGRIAPLLPGVNEGEAATLIGSVAAAGAVAATLGLPAADDPALAAWLAAHRPGEADRVRARLGPVHRRRILRTFAAALAERRLAAARPPLSGARYRPPKGPAQLSLDL